MDRHGSLKKSMKLAEEVVNQGSNLLIYPEGTRARDGQLAPFKPALGYLSLHCRVPILPVYLGGTFEALPVGSVMPKEKNLYVRIGQPIHFEDLQRHTESWARSEAYRYISDLTHDAIKRLGGLEEPLASPNSSQESFMSFESEISIGKSRT